MTVVGTVELVVVVVVVLVVVVVASDSVLTDVTVPDEVVVVDDAAPAGAGSTLSALLESSSAPTANVTRTREPVIALTKRRSYGCRTGVVEKLSARKINVPLATRTGRHLCAVVAEVQGLEAARAWLRESQRGWARSVPLPDAPNTLEDALSRTAAQEDAVRRDGDWVYDGTFRYPEASERARWAKTREILERTAPGPYEDANYIAMLAHQAAAIELSIPRWSRYEAQAEDLLGRVIIGTTVEPRSTGSTSAVAGCSVIEMSAGMVDLLYQSAKAIVLAWKRNDPGAEGRLSFSTRAEDTDALLDRDPYPTELLYDTLAAWLYDGRHRASYSTVPPPEYHAPLKLLINGAERFVIAHEYGHATLMSRSTSFSVSRWRGR